MVRRSMIIRPSVVETNDSGSIIAEYNYDDYGRPLTRKRDGKIYYYVFNARKDVVALNDAWGKDTL